MRFVFLPLHYASIEVILMVFDHCNKKVNKLALLTSYLDCCIVLFHHLDCRESASIIITQS